MTIHSTDGWNALTIGQPGKNMVWKSGISDAEKDAAEVTAQVVRVRGRDVLLFNGRVWEAA